MKRQLFALLLVLLLPAAALADQSQLVGTSVEGTSTTQTVNAGIEVGYSNTGTLSGALNGTVSSHNGIYFGIESGDYAGYSCFLSDWTATIGGHTYTGISRQMEGPGGSLWVAADGDTGFVGHAGGAPNTAVFDLTSFLGVQHSGTALWTMTSETGGTWYDVSVPLTVTPQTFTGEVQGYYNGSLTANLTNLEADLSQLVIEGLPDRLKMMFIDYDSYLGAGKGFEVKYDQRGLGAIDGPLYGIVRDLEGEPTTFEHAGTASPVPLPAPVLLFGSGLVGLLGLRRRR
jgi:hypothetical protein